MSTTRPLDVTVAGGGIGGATAALLLARSGHTVTVLERVPKPTAVGAGILLQPNGLAVLHGLGLQAALEATATRMDMVRLLRTDLTPVAAEPIPDFGSGLDHLVVLRRSHLAAALADALEAEPGVTVEYGHAVEDAAALPGDLVVGADGIHSVVRDQGDFGATVSSTGSTYLRTIVAPTLDLDGEIWTRLGLFGSAGLGDGTYFYADISDPEVVAAVEARDLARLQALWAQVLPASRGLFEAVESFDDLLVNEVRQVDCRTWVDGRSVLLGDAAHAMEPTLGQGANSAIVDAAVLALELGRASLPAALAAYDARRRPAVANVQNDAGRLARASRLRSPVARRVRDFGIRAAARPGPSARRYRQVQQEDPADLLARVHELTA